MEPRENWLKPIVAKLAMLRRVRTTLLIAYSFVAGLLTGRREWIGVVMALVGCAALYAFLSREMRRLVKGQ